MPKTLFFSLFLLAALGTKAQSTLIFQHNSPAGQAPPAAAAPAAPTSDNTALLLGPASESKEERRAAAVAKVQKAKAMRPATYSLSPAEGSAPMRPMQYSTPTTNAKGGDILPATYSTEPMEVPGGVAPTTVTVNGQAMHRDVRKGMGQVGADLFTPVKNLCFVQFAVYCKDTPVDKAPAIEGLYLLWHAESTCPGGDQGASYIVKGYRNADEARAAVREFKANGVDCWYNPALTGVELEIIGVR